MFENSIVDMFDTLIHFRRDGLAEPAARSSRTDPGLWTVAAIHADSDRALHSEVWERHPSGNEVLCVLSGAMRVHVPEYGDGEEPVATLSAGQSFVVPVGQWHRLTVAEPGDLLAITPRADTQHEKVGAAKSGGAGTPPSYR